jgi:hypothetical protein
MSATGLASQGSPTSRAADSRRDWATNRASDMAARTLIALTVVGATLRLLQYVQNPALSFDETLLALNVLERSPRDLLDTLDFNQAAPLGYLMIVKGSSMLFGGAEYALRLPALLASLVSLILFAVASRRLLPPAGAIVATAVFALFDPLIYYSAVAKPYAFDVLAATAVLAAGSEMLRSRATTRTALLLVAGAIVVALFAYGGAFPLAALLALVLAREIRWSSRRRIVQICAVGAAIVTAAAIPILVSQSGIRGIQHSFGSGDRVAGVQLLTTLSDSDGLFADLTSRLRYLVGLEDTAPGTPVLHSLPDPVNQALTVLILATVIAGFVSLLFRSRGLAGLVALPPIFALAASALGLYPLVGRTLLFLLPSIALCIGEAAARAGEATSRYALAARSGVVVVAGTVAAIALLPAQHLVAPRTDEEMRTVLGFIGDHRRAGDALYVSTVSQYGVAYYHLCRCAPFDAASEWPFSVTTGTAPLSPAIEALSPLLTAGQGAPEQELAAIRFPNRVWILTSGVLPSHRSRLEAELDARGRRLLTFVPDAPPTEAAVAYLYDFSGNR